MNADELAVVYISQGPLAAEVIRAKLVAAGIDTHLRYQAVGRALGLTVDGLGRVEVCVRLEDSRAARELVECDSELED
jgi:hypothetical protein